MKSELPDDKLNALLREWKVDAEPHPRFAEGVWRRIAQREAKAASSTLSARWQRWLSGINRRTGVAWGAAATIVITMASAWLGHRAAVNVAATPTAETYLTSADPYRMPP